MNRVVRGRDREEKERSDVEAQIGRDLGYLSAK